MCKKKLNIIFRKQGKESSHSCGKLKKLINIEETAKLYMDSALYMR